MDDNLTRQMKTAMQLALGGAQALEIPAAGQLVWAWFLDLARTRTGNGFGPNPISYAEISAYDYLYGWQMEPRHVRMIMALDRVWLDHARGTSTGGQSKSALAPAQPVTPEAFDAVFG